MIELFRHLPDEEDGRKEELHQIDCASYVEAHYPHLNFFHVANETGTKAKIQFVVKRQRMGVKKGVADMQIMTPTASGEFPFSSVELKRPDRGSRPSPDQKEYLSKVYRDGGLAVVCWGHMAFRRFLEKYYK